MHRGVGWQGEKDCEGLTSRPRVDSSEISRADDFRHGRENRPLSFVLHDGLLLLPTVFSGWQIFFLNRRHDDIVRVHHFV
jgi:hypothetical protein